MIGMWKGLDKGDRYAITSTVAVIIVWWVYKGRNRYSMKGMK